MSTTRRHFLGQAAAGLGVAGLSALGGRQVFADESAVAALAQAKNWGAGPGALKGLPHFAPKAKRVIILWMGGGMSHVDLYDHKPNLEKLKFQDLPDSVRSGARLSSMTAGYKSFPILP